MKSHDDVIAIKGASIKWFNSVFLSGGETLHSYQHSTTDKSGSFKCRLYRGNVHETPLSQTLGRLMVCVITDRSERWREKKISVLNPNNTANAVCYVQLYNIGLWITLNFIHIPYLFVYFKNYTNKFRYFLCSFTCKNK